MYLPVDHLQCGCAANNKKGSKHATHNIRLACRHFGHIFTQLISDVMFVSMHKETILITNCFGIFITALPLKGLKDVLPFQMFPQATGFSGPALRARMMAVMSIFRGCTKYLASCSLGEYIAYGGP